MADIERRFPRSLRHLLDAFSHRFDRCTCFMNEGENPGGLRREMDASAANLTVGKGCNSKAACVLEDVLQRDSLLDLLARFPHLDVD